MTSTVGDVLRSKGRAIYSIDARRTVHDAEETASEGMARGDGDEINRSNAIKPINAAM